MFIAVWNVIKALWCKHCCNVAHLLLHTRCADTAMCTICRIMSCDSWMWLVRILSHAVWQNWQLTDHAHITVWQSTDKHVTVHWPCPSPTWSLNHVWLQSSQAYLILSLMRHCCANFLKQSGLGCCIKQQQQLDILYHYKFLKMPVFGSYPFLLAWGSATPFLQSISWMS